MRRMRSISCLSETSMNRGGGGKLCFLRVNLTCGGILLEHSCHMQLLLHLIVQVYVNKKGGILNFIIFFNNML